jgi:uncharacterized protein YndB with AHSA1/START domain
VETALWLLLVIGHIGLLDVVVYHGIRAAVPLRASSQFESRVHAVRHVVYGLQFLWIANIALHGLALLWLLPLYIADMGAAWFDVWIEQDSRKDAGGLERGEYLLHIVLSFLVGMYFLALILGLIPWWSLPTAVVWQSPVNVWVQGYMSLMGVTAVLLGAWGLWPTSADTAPRRIVTEAILHAEPQRIWDHTVQPEAHVRWDLRFDVIRFDGQPDGPDERRLEYITRVVPGFTIHGFGSYKDTEHLKVSAFRFDSDDWRSLMHTGKGVWSYLPRPDGSTLFRSVYDYETRFGAPGLYLDRWVFRPMLSLATEYSFETLRLWVDGGQDPSLRASRVRFLAYALRRLIARRIPAVPLARGWIGSGTLEERTVVG